MLQTQLQSEAKNMGGTWECFPYSVPCFLWIVFPQSLAEVINKKKPQRCLFFLFWKWKIKHFFFHLEKLLNFCGKRKGKEKKRLMYQEQVGQVQVREGNAGSDYLKSMNLMLSNQLRTCIIPDAKTNWPRTECSFPIFHLFILQALLVFKWKTACF